jgi:hypothetical protein
MLSELLRSVGTLLLGGFVTGVGAITILYPEASYRIRTAWKHEEVTLSSRGRSDQKGLGVVLTLLGIVIMYVAIA